MKFISKSICNCLFMMYFKNVIKKYGNSRVVVNVPEFSVSEGIYWLKGENGSGKTTLLKIAAGFLPFSGDILVNNFSLKNKGVEYRQLVNYAPAEPQYPSFITGTELLQFISEIKKGTPQQVALIKEALNITDFLDNPVGTYSSGMLKKLSLLLAFTGCPAYILLDEPFTTLDASTQASLKEYIGYISNEGVSFIITSHHDIDANAIKFDGSFLLNNAQILMP